MSSAGQRKDSLESLGRQHVHVGVEKKKLVSVLLCLLRRLLLLQNVVLCLNVLTSINLSSF